MVVARRQTVQAAIGVCRGNMKPKVLTTFVGAVLLLFCSTPLLSPSNNRPITPLGDNGIEDNLQEILARLVVAGSSIDAVHDQVSASLFRSGACLSSLVTRFSDNSRIASESIVGIYSAADPTNRAVFFAGEVPAGSQVTVVFRADKAVLVNGVVAATDFVQPFGLFVSNSETGHHYSEDSRNPAARAQALLFRGTGGELLAGSTRVEFGNDAYLAAFEDRGAGTGDSDYQDLKLMISGIVPASERSAQECSARPKKSFDSRFAK
jgi:hypothetical protein